MTARKQAFISYSHADKEYVDRLRLHLKPLEDKYDFEIWNDDKIKVGDKWKEEIRENLEKSTVVVLVISADFLASDFVMKYEYPEALKMAQAQGTKIVVVIASPCLFDEFEISEFQAVNSSEETLLDLEEKSADQERVFVKCARIVSRYLKQGP